MRLIENIGMIVGLGLSILSFAMYYRRTRCQTLIHWLGADGVLTRTEYFLKRTGFTIFVVAGICLAVDLVLMVSAHD